MNDKQRADRIVALGIGRTFTPNRTGTGEFYAPPGVSDCLSDGMNESAFVQDRRVIDALLERAEWWEMDSYIND